MKLSCTLLSLALQVFATGSLAADTNSWKSRNIYFALTDRIARGKDDNGGGICGDLGNYCGGTFGGLEGKLDYIKGMGFDAIWINPVVENSDGGYHGYWAKDLYSINPKFGSADDLKSLVNAAHDKDMFVMVDVVANHMGNGPISENKPELLSRESSYHPACSIDYSDQHSIENCRIAGLPDVNTQSQEIRKLYQDWISWLVGEFSFDGVRIDTVKHVHEDFWSDFSLASGVYTIGEVLNGDPAYLARYDMHMASVFNYAVYYPLNDFYLQQGSSQALVDTHNEMGAQFSDPTSLGTFIDNHDQPRWLSKNGDRSLLKNALAYVILARGIPIVYYGTEQGYGGSSDPGNREDLWGSGYDTNNQIYQAIARLSNARKVAGGLSGNDHTHLYVEDGAYAWSRVDGKLVVLTTNGGEGYSDEHCLHSKKPNYTWRDIYGSGTYTADENGLVCVTVTNGEPVVMLAQ